MNRPIVIGLSPNTQKDDVLLALKNLLKPWQYQKGDWIGKFEEWFKNYFKIPYAISFQNGRSALYAILSCLKIGINDEVMLQAFTCVVVPNAIIATGAKPVYVDIDNSLTLNPGNIEKKITKKTKAIIVQHTFGIPADMDAIGNIAKKHNIIVIEDVAHTIGGTYKGKKLGTFGAASIFSFGRDKAFSSVFGGIAITSNKILGEKLQLFQQEKNYPSNFWIIRQLFYPVICFFILTFYHFFSIGKIFHFLFRKIHFLSFPVDQSEKKGTCFPKNIKRFPNALANLAFLQVKKIETYNQQRKDFAEAYIKEIKNLLRDTPSTGSIPIATVYEGKEPLCRFPLLIKDKQKIKRYFAQQGMYIGDWYNQAIDPAGTDFKKVSYTKGACPTAEELAANIINLPTHPTMTKDDGERVLKTLKEYLETV